MNTPRDFRFRPLRAVRLGGERERRYESWLAGIDEELSDPDTDRYALCRRLLEEIHLPADASPCSPEPGVGASLTRSVLRDQLDPRNVTLEPEYYHEIDLERYDRVKPLIWLWEMFDRSVLGENVHLGVRFRRILAKRIFSRCGRNFKAFHHVKMSFGYGLEVGDDVVVHRHVLLDDRGGIRIGDRASISDFANVYSHAHHIGDARLVRTPATIIGEDSRIAYHATVLAGVELAPGSMIGAAAVVTRDTEPDTVHIGIPARPAARRPSERAHPPTPDPLGDPASDATRD